MGRHGGFDLVTFGAAELTNTLAAETLARFTPRPLRAELRPARNSDLAHPIDDGRGIAHFKVAPFNRP